MSQDAIARAREIAARLSGSIGLGGGGDLGKRKNRWDEDGNPGLGSIKRKKIYIPVKEHPDINFLGLLIGPRGVTQKQMQERTGAKIIIRGVGSAKDGGPSITNHPDDNDELHVAIEGPDDAVERAFREVEQILFDPEQANRLKTEQLNKLAEMNGGSSDGVYGPGGGGQYQIELRVPNNMVGLVIGKGGENILRIQTQLSVSAQIAKETDMLPGETLRSIVLKGSEENVNEAKKRIDEIINTRLNLNASNNMSRGSKELDSSFVVKLPVPNDKVGIIIGKGGMTVKGIQERCGATIQIPAGPDENDPNVRTLSIGGDSKEAVDKAQREIYMTLQMQQQQALNAYNASSSIMPVVVPDDKVGIIIGKGGITIKEIQNRLRVKVQIPQVADLGSNPPVRTLSVIGTPEQQAIAKYEIEMIAAGTPVNGNNSNANSYGSYGISPTAAMSMSMWGATQPAYGMMAGYYGAAGGYGAMAAPYMQAQGYGAAYYGDMNYTAQTGDGSTAAATTEAAPSDPTAYYNDFWHYASYYGEAAARLYYQAWSPPEGALPPEGVVVPADPNANLTNQSTDSVNHNTTAANTSSTSTTNNATAQDKGAILDAEVDPEEAAAAWESYKKQYAEWYEAYGKDIGADPNPPAM